MAIRMRWLWIGTLLTLLVGCGPERQDEADPAPPPSPAAAEPATEQAAAEAQRIFETRCATCHGADGSGTGPVSKGLTPPPRDFRDAEWQHSVTDEHIANIVKFGGAAVGKSPAMPGNPDLVGKPEVVAELVVHVRELPSSQ